MINKKISTMFLVILLAAFAFEAWAGPLVWGPQKCIRDTGPPVPITETFTIEKPMGKFWLQVGNGGHIKRPDIKPGAVEPVNQASSAYIKLNGVEVVGPDDLNQNIYGFTKDITLQANNTIEVEVRGKPESYITVEIRKAESNVTVGNKNYDLRSLNMKDQIVLWWSSEERASRYVIYKAYSIDGPWTEWGSGYAGEPMNEVDITSEAETRDLCYKIEALDSSGKVIRRYEPICVPKWQTEESALPLTMENLSDTSVEPAIAGSTQTSSASYNDMCLSDNDFTNTSTMSYEDIKKFLQDKDSFLKEDGVKDVNGHVFDPTEFIDFAAQTYGINPQVLLTTLQKESGAVRTPLRLPVKDLKHIMGYSKPSTITDQILDGTAQMRRDFDRLSNGQPTAGEWQKGVTKNSLDPLPVTPANKAVAVLFSYTPWVGQEWGGRKGGNALFCQVWKDFGFFKPTDCGASKICYTTRQMYVNQTQTLTVTNPVPGTTYTWNVASGGGSISPTTGTSVSYTAPASNPNCYLNPNIQMSAEGAVCDTLKIAVTKVVTGGAYRTNYLCASDDGSDPVPCNFCLCLCDEWDVYGCDNQFLYRYDLGGWFVCGCGVIETNWPYFCALGTVCPMGGTCVDPTDVRTPAQKNAGCCPAELLP
ncbi:MAG: hypothetical protein WC560_10650 [Syntrophales bacterium]